MYYMQLVAIILSNSLLNCNYDSKYIYDYMTLCGMACVFVFLQKIRYIETSSLIRKWDVTRLSHSQ